MFKFLSLTAIKIVLKFTLAFMGLAALPLYFIFWLKKRNPPSPVIELLNRCIRHGQVLSSEECTKINGCINEIKSSLAGFAKGVSTSSESGISLAQAIELLPLLYEISQPNTCCEPVPEELNYSRGVDCKSSIRALLKELKTAEQLPLIPEELERITKARQKMISSQRRRKPLAFLLFLVYFYTSILLSQTILSIRTSWGIELGTYLGCLLIFFLNYNYYFTKEFKRYQKRIKR
jgi:hypothetical protein